MKEGRTLVDSSTQAKLTQIPLGLALDLLRQLTRTAADVDTYERASELERLGGDVIELAPTDWKALND